VSGTSNSRGVELVGQARREAEAALARLPCIAGLEAEARAILSGHVTIREYRTGAVVIKYGEAGDSCFIVITGSVSASRVESTKGKELTYRNLGAGAVFGEIAVLTDTPRTTDIVADTRTVIAVIPAKSFLELLGVSPSFSLYLLRSMAHRLRSSAERLSDLSFLDLNQRLFATLSRLSISIELDGEQRIIVRELPPRQYLASLLNCSREAVSRALKQLEEQAMISIDGDSVEILERAPT
jgi:CRP/FNR family cyclic AMP-dependent transcriptional regulator